MTDTAATIQLAKLTALLSGFGVRQLRLATGIVLFAFLVSHFLNHALGKLSLGAMEQALNTHHSFWQGQPVKAIFYLSALVHTALGLWMPERRQFRYDATEATQLVLG